VEEEVANSMKPDELIAIRRKLRMERWELGEAVWLHWRRLVLRSILHGKISGRSSATNAPPEL